MIMVATCFSSPAFPKLKSGRIGNHVNTSLPVILPNGKLMKSEKDSALADDGHLNNMCFNTRNIQTFFLEQYCNHSRVLRMSIPEIDNRFTLKEYCKQIY